MTDDRPTETDGGYVTVEYSKEEKQKLYGVGRADADPSQGLGRRFVVRVLSKLPDGGWRR